MNQIPADGDEAVFVAAAPSKKAGLVARRDDTARLLAGENPATLVNSISLR
jgi:hypothetical protein